MGFQLAKKTLSPIGIDFGVDSIKLLQVVMSDPPQLVAAASMDIPEHARTDMNARHAFVCDALKQLMRKGKFKGKRVMCSIPAFQTLVQNFEVSAGENDNIDGQVEMQLRQRLNVDPARMVVRSYPVGKVVRDGQSRQEVICMAASREAVMRYIDTARRAKLDVIGMHAEPTLIMHAFAHLYRRESDAERTTCFLDIGAATTKVLIAHGKDVVFAKTIHAAGDHLTRERARLDQLSFAEARSIRMREAEEGVAPPAAPPAHPATAPATASARPDGNVTAPAPAAAVDVERRTGEHRLGPAITEKTAATPNDAGDGDAIDCLIEELQLCLRYHQRTYSDRRIEKLVFLGGESHQVGNCQRIAKALRIGAQLGDPLARMVRINQVGSPTGVDIRKPQPAWAVPLGLCLSEPNL